MQCLNLNNNPNHANKGKSRCAINKTNNSAEATLCPFRYIMNLFLIRFQMF